MTTETTGAAQSLFVTGRMMPSANSLSISLFISSVIAYGISRGLASEGTCILTSIHFTHFVFVKSTVLLQ